MRIHKGCGKPVERDPATSGPWGDLFKCPEHGGPLGIFQIEYQQDQAQAHRAD